MFRFRDLDAERAASAFAVAGYADEDIIIADSSVSATAALEKGRRVAIQDATIVPELPIDIVVEATGNPKRLSPLAWRLSTRSISRWSRKRRIPWSARIYLNGRTRRVSSQRRSMAINRALIGLLSWARLLGLNVVAAGKSSEYDFVYEIGFMERFRRGEAIALPDFADVWVMPERGVKETVGPQRDVVGVSAANGTRFV